MPTPRPDETGGAAPPPWLKRYVIFTDSVAKACTKPAGRKALRPTSESFQSPPVINRMYRVLGKNMPPAHREAAYLMVAAMYADQAALPPVKNMPPPPTYDPGYGNLGWSLKQAVAAEVLTAKSADREISALARTAGKDIETLYSALRPLVGRISRKQIPVSWPHLLCDLNLWQRDTGSHEKIAGRWVRSYHQSTYMTP